MSYAQPRLGVYDTTPFLFSQQPSQQPIAISPLPGIRLNESVQNAVISQKSFSKSVTQVTQTVETVADREVIVLSSDSESDSETIRSVVSRKMKGKAKVNVNKNLEASASIIVDQFPTSNSDANRTSVADNNTGIGSLSNRTNESKSTHESGIFTNRKNLDDYCLIQSNKEKPSLSRITNPVRNFLNILEGHKTNVGLYEIIVDFTKIYLEIYGEDKRIITNLHDFQILVVDLIYCLMLKMKDVRYMKTERFKQVELLAKKATEAIDKINETGEIIKRIEDYNHNVRKRKNEEEGNLQDKRRKQCDDGIDRTFRIFVDEGDRLEMDKREEKESVRKDWEELKKQMKSQVNKILPSKKPDHPSMPASLQFDIQLPRPKNEEKFVELLAEPLHDLITAQLVYDLYKSFTPFHLSETVKKCSVSRIFKCNHSEKNEYCKQLYRQYINTNMKGTANVLGSWIKSRISEYAKPYLAGKKR